MGIGVDSPAADEPVIEARGLTKSFGRSVALAGLDLMVGSGEVHAFLGPNGAGKTTTLRMLLGLLRADGGEVRVLGLDPWSKATELHLRLAYVPGDVNLWPNLTGGEVIDLLGRMRGGLDPDRRAALVGRFELDPSRKCRTYSKGNRQKVALIAALARDVELYLLDEPTSGLDPLMESEFRQVLAELRADGRTVLLSSHVLSEAEAVSDHVTIIRRGRTVETGALADLRHLTSMSVRAELSRSPGRLDTIEGVGELSIDGNRVSARVEPIGVADFVAALADAGVVTLESRPPTLEELFLRHYADGSEADGSEADGSEADGSE